MHIIVSLGSLFVTVDQTTLHSDQTLKLVAKIKSAKFCQERISAFVCKQTNFRIYKRANDQLSELTKLNPSRHD
jgi:hypothetical protein